MLQRPLDSLQDWHFGRMGLVVETPSGDDFVFGDLEITGVPIIISDQTLGGKILPASQIVNSLYEDVIVFRAEDDTFSAISFAPDKESIDFNSGVAQGVLTTGDPRYQKLSGKKSWLCWDTNAIQ